MTEKRTSYWPRGQNRGISQLMKPLTVMNTVNKNKNLIL